MGIENVGRDIASSCLLGEMKNAIEGMMEVHIEDDWDEDGHTIPGYCAAVKASSEGATQSDIVAGLRWAVATFDWIEDGESETLDFARSVMQRYEDSSSGNDTGRE